MTEQKNTLTKLNVIMLYKVLKELASGKKSQSLISKKADVTLCHLWKIVRKLEAEGLATSEFSGRTRIVSITDKGLDAFNRLNLYFQDFAYLH